METDDASTRGAMRKRIVARERKRESIAGKVGNLWDTVSQRVSTGTEVLRGGGLCYDELSFSECEIVAERQRVFGYE